MSHVARRFVEEAATLVSETHLERIRRALELVPPDRLFWRPHEGVPSIGNLLLHLEGNVRQWWLSGLGGAEDTRDRPAEFEAREGDADELFARLARTVRCAADAVRALDEDALLAERTIQGFRADGVFAVLHVAEHFAWHTGQIVWIAKLLAGPEHGLAFYDEEAINRAHNRPNDG